MRSQRERGNHRQQVKKEDDITRERVRNISAPNHLEVVPQSLVDKPQGHAGRHQNPEETNARKRATRRKNVRRKSNGGDEQQSSLYQIIGDGEGVAPREKERGRDLRQDQAAR